MRFSLKGKDKKVNKDVKNVLSEEGEKKEIGEINIRQTPLVIVEDEKVEDEDNKPCIIPANSNSLAKTPTEEDYAKLPPGVFGMALLRGMESQSKDKSEHK